jgi:glycosyltransferase involved in cell wall biosynthesis
MSDTSLFTVFTPTFNRAHTIHRVFDSLRAQTLRDFEWLVVDDGSTDNTSELIASWAKTADFPIRYFKQDHLGKHFAQNLALQYARGRFFLPLSSDDAAVPTALERMAHHWNTIPVADRAHFSGVDGLCRSQRGQIIGDRFPSDPFDVTLRDRRYIHKLRGEKWGFTLTEIVRRFPFPEIEGTHFTPEGLVWLDIAKTYKSRCVNEIFRTYYVDDGETGATLTKTRLDENAPGRLRYYSWLLDNDLEYFFHRPTTFLKAAIVLPSLALFAGQPLTRMFKMLGSVPAKSLVLSLLPFSLSLYVFDRIRGAGTRKKNKRVQQFGAVGSRRPQS